MEYFKKTGSIPIHSYNKLWLNQSFTILQITSLVEVILYEAWFFVFAKNKPSNFLTQFSLILSHISSILIISTVVVALIYMNHVNMIESRQRIDKFGVDTKLEAVLWMTLIDSFFNFFIFVKGIIFNSLYLEKEMFFFYIFFHLFINFINLFLIYILHEDLFNFKEKRKIKEFGR
ncbi:hypothetical protein TUBRATIS_28460 [Tubulinosema ratisbonensis]|uniref:Uncharacterized protein n=1 Tax=Tubulinosema ratisbonensis TaxID=291195 RepID=A0A437AI39_9MICR|nr:hypothetical protein TUBRATIS_28460 [Tubulinosema ratisbonensis]